MKSLINLAACLLEDSGRLCSVETARDLIRIRHRAQHEGISFLTITLPDFSSEFERALESGQVDSTYFAGWQKKGCLPAFLWGFTSLVFETGGKLYGSPSESAIYCVRQICRAFKKIRLDCSDERLERAFTKFEQTERDLAGYVPPTEGRASHFYGLCDLLWRNVLGLEFNTFELVPKHGPGATAERVAGNGKYAHLSWNSRLEAEFPFTDNLFSSLSQVECEHHGINNVTVVSESEELPVRVIQVPKDLKTPRTIAIEPVCMQYTQQGVARWIVNKIQQSPLTRGAIRFNDQTVNQRLAMQSSFDRSSSTIDLSDASDRVPYQMVRQMLRSVPNLWEAVDACRSRTAELPGGRILTLQKFASMGSALCFPIESMYFYSIIVHAIMWKRTLPVTHANFVKCARGVHVFGDDIIIPRHETDSVIEALTQFNCRVNTRKSYWNGKFRESCGIDAYNGVDVTPVYVRESAPSNRQGSPGTVSWISTSNQFHLIGMWQTADYMKTVVERSLGSLPVVRGTSPGLGWMTFSGSLPTPERMCRYTHVPLVFTYKVKARRVTDNLDGYPALLKYFLGAENREIDALLKPLATDKKHLTSSARRGAVSRKRHWVPSM